MLLCLVSFPPWYLTVSMVTLHLLKLLRAWRIVKLIVVWALDESLSPPSTKLLNIATWPLVQRGLIILWWKSAFCSIKSPISAGSRIKVLLTVLCDFAAAPSISFEDGARAWMGCKSAVGKRTQQSHWFLLLHLFCSCCYCVFKPSPYILLPSMCSVIWNLGLTEYGCIHKIVMRSSSTEWLPYRNSILIYVLRLLVLSGLTLFLLHSCTSLPISRRAGFEFASLHKCNLWCLMLEKEELFNRQLVVH